MSISKSKIVCLVCDKEVVHSDESQMFVLIGMIREKVHAHCFQKFPNSAAFKQFVHDKNTKKKAS